MTKVTLKYEGGLLLGHPLVFNGTDIRMWTIVQGETPSVGSTLGLRGLKEAGII